MGLDVAQHVLEGPVGPSYEAGITDNGEAKPGPGERHVDPTPVVRADEAELAGVVAASDGEERNVRLTALDGVNTHDSDRHVA